MFSSIFFFKLSRIMFFFGDISLVNHVQLKILLNLNEIYINLMIKFNKKEFSLTEESNFRKLLS